MHDGGYFEIQQQEREMDEAAIKRGLFKTAKNGNVQEFNRFIQAVPGQKRRL